MSDDLTASLTVFGAPPRPALVTVTRALPGQRFARAARAAGIFWAVAGGCVFLPGLHFVLVPTFLIVGVAAELRHLRDMEVVSRVHGACPRCEREQDFEGAASRCNLRRPSTDQGCGSQDGEDTERRMALSHGRSHVRHLAGPKALAASDGAPRERSGARPRRLSAGARPARSPAPSSAAHSDESSEGRSRSSSIGRAALTRTMSRTAVNNRWSRRPSARPTVALMIPNVSR